MIDEMTVTRIVSATPQECHDLVADIENYPRWASDLDGVDVLSRDDEGRPSHATFAVAAFGRSAKYTLAYDHSQAPGRIAWHLVSGDIVKRLDGHYEFEPVAGNAQATSVTYRLSLELAIPLPGFVKRRAESRIAHAAIDDLQYQLESGTKRNEVST